MYEKIIKDKSICLIHKSFHPSKENTKAKVFVPSIARSVFSISYWMVIHELSKVGLQGYTSNSVKLPPCYQDNEKKRFNHAYYIISLIFRLRSFSVGKKLSQRFLKSSFSCFAQLLVWTKFCLVVFVLYEMVAADINIE